MKNKTEILNDHENPFETMKNQPGTLKIMNNHKNPSGTVNNHPVTMKNQPGTSKNQPGTLKTHKNWPGTMRNQPETLKTHKKPTWNHEKPSGSCEKPWKLIWSCTGWLRVVMVVTYRRLRGGGAHFLLQTDRHFIIIYISSSWIEKFLQG